MLTGPATFSLLFVGVSLAEDAATVAIASQMGVPFSTLLSIWLLGETIRWRRRLGITLAFARHRHHQLRSARVRVLGRARAGGAVVLLRLARPDLRQAAA